MIYRRLYLYFHNVWVCLINIPKEAFSAIDDLKTKLWRLLRFPIRRNHRAKK